MLFKTTTLSAEFAGTHPELRHILRELDEYIQDAGMPTLTLTHVLRTPEEQEEIYWRKYWHATATEKDARAEARRRFSWHMAGCAADFRNTTYSDEQRAQIRKWLTSKFQKPHYEVFEHDIGRGEHFHFAVCDFGWRRKYEQELRRKEGSV